jgi:hypothetical protein
MLKETAKIRANDSTNNYAIFVPIYLPNTPQSRINADFA